MVRVPFQSQKSKILTTNQTSHILTIKIPQESTKNAQSNKNKCEREGGIISVKLNNNGDTWEEQNRRSDSCNNPQHSHKTKCLNLT